MVGSRYGLAVAALLGWGLTSPVLAEPRPIVVELFTSQGCSSCPPADALLGELARRGDVIALGFHVDYWDGLGWKDPLSSPEATARQRAYAHQFGRRQVYTPQLVVDGADEAVGSDRAEVTALLRRAKPEAAAPVSFSPDGRAVSIGTGNGTGRVLLVRYALHRTTRVAAGENARHTAEDANGVEALQTLGDWKGSALTYQFEPPAGGEGVAVLVQAADGRILGAAMTTRSSPAPKG
jgi:hypothetical protein